MAIVLKKGERINVDLAKVSVGLGWNPNQGTGAAFDLDASAFMIGKDNLIPSEGYFVYYNNTDSPDGALHHSGDDKTGGNSEHGDDEIISVDLDKVDKRVEQIVFVVTIDNAKARKQNFGQVEKSYIRLVNEQTNEEMAKYELGEDFSVETGIEFARLYRKDGAWKFKASGVGHQEDLEFFVRQYFKGEVV